MTNFPDVTDSTGTARMWADWLLTKGGPPAKRYPDPPRARLSGQPSRWQEWRAFVITALAGAACIGFVVAAYASLGPAMTLRASNADTGERIVLTIKWESWPDKVDPDKRCQEAAIYLNGQIERAKFTIDEVGCAP